MGRLTEQQRLQTLEASEEFLQRHIGPDEQEIRAMLTTVGATSVDALIDTVVPDAIRMKTELALPPALPEHLVRDRARELAALNKPMTSMIGMGYYDCHTPSVIRRNILENPGWYTAYTPYQAEVSQGRMEALLNYQQMIVDLTGMPLANASLLDEATAAAEAMSMIARVTKKTSNRFFVDGSCHPQTIAVVRTRAESVGIELVVGDSASEFEQSDCFGILLQYPQTDGQLGDPRDIINKAHAMEAMAVVATDLLALCLIESPGRLGADVVVGSSQRFGVPMGFGGPHAAFFATHEKFKRNIPGRIIGVSVDRHGNRALRMALQTREQHIRREKATSNICTAQVLLAIMASMFAVYHGADGIRRIAERTHRLARIFCAGLAASERNLDLRSQQFFDTVTVRVADTAAAVVSDARSRGINLRLLDEQHVSIAFDETSTREDVEKLWQAFSINGAEVEKHDTDELSHAIPQHLLRQDLYLQHVVFQQHRTETEMLRYLRKLQNRDIALDRSMIALGSCTMKLNATTEMEPVTEPGFARLHPFAPADHSHGYQQLFEELEQDLCEITGYDAVSLQPNAGSQGEYAGLLAIRGWHLSRGDTQRDVCLIPSSAHGTNPASAVMAGMRVVVVGCDADGNIDVDDLDLKINEHRQTIAALMITYPSTHGVFESAVVDICKAVHTAGGQVYLDGANLNAMVGICRPGDIGADVSHLNLHKTFCIPHGGGGPGMGPIGVKSHLTEFLPGHPMQANSRSSSDTTISAAPTGSASILPISWAYIKLMGNKGLTDASKIAILNANYVARRLNRHFPVIYTGINDMVAHECIIDMSAFKETADVGVEDVAKRLVDYGYHAPTMSWPVADSMMIEPTESESKTELDRFCDAMISIRGEIKDIEEGRADREDNLLRNAPHTALELTEENWRHPYSRESAFFPTAELRDNKYWPPVARIDNVHGDRHLMCTCPTVDEYRDDDVA